MKNYPAAIRLLFFCLSPLLLLLSTGYAQTYTTIANGNWTSAATWQGGSIPSNMNPLPLGATVNIRHTINYNEGVNITNNGAIRIQPVSGTVARLNMPTAINVENNPTGQFYIIDGSYVQFRFTPGNNGEPYSGNTPGATLQSGSFKNIGGYIECRNFFAEIAQDWTNESNGTRIYKNGCIYTGQNFSLSGSGSIDTIIGVNLSIGWHASGNYSLSDGKAFYQGLRFQLAGTSGSFQLNSGTAWGDIDYIMLRNHVVPFSGGGLIFASSSLAVDDPATPGTVNLNLDVRHTGTYTSNGKFTGTQTSTWPGSPLGYFPGDCPAGGAAPIINVDVSINKTVNNTGCYNNSDTRIFTLTATNPDDNHTATVVTVNDLLPAGLTFVSSAGDGSYNSGSGVWTIGDIYSGLLKSRTITAMVSGTVERTNTASFGPLQQTDLVFSNNTSSVTLSPCIVLPALGLKASVRMNGAWTTVQWKTESENSSDYFVVERSPDNISFNTIGQKQAAGNSTTTIHYELADNLATLTTADRIYYRVKLMDTDGSFSYSNVATVKLLKDAGASVWPNPFISQLFISVQSSTQTTYDIKLLDAAGKTVQRYSLAAQRGNNQFVLSDLKEFKSGMYIIQVSDKNGTLSNSFRLIKE